jgi:hypothetical protein
LGVITLQGTRVMGDFRRAEYFAYYRRPWHQTLVLVFFLLIFAMAIAGYVQGHHGNLAWGAPYFLLFVVWLASGVGIPWSTAKSKTAGQPWRGEATTFVFDTEGVRVATASMSSDVRWGVLREVCETKNLFLLRSGEGLPVVIPKRFFASAEEMNVWKSFVQEQMKCRPIAMRELTARWC